MKTWTAIVSNSTVLSPGIGVWIPECREGAMISSGQPLGRILRAGQSIEVLAPVMEPTPVGEVCAAYTAVEYGGVLFSFGLGEARTVDEEASGLRLPAGFVEVCAPMAGTLYQQPSPGAAPFAPIGSTVDAQATLGLVEVMKSLNPVRSAVRGHVERWLVADGEPVSSGQALLWMRPSDTSG